MKRYISSGSKFEEIVGYSRAVVDGDWCFLAGTTGYDYETMQMPEGVEVQIDNCFTTIKSVLTEAGFTFEDIVRANYILSDVDHCALAMPRFGQTYGQY